MNARIDDRMNARIDARKNASTNARQKSRIECQYRCQVECQNRCQTGCQIYRMSGQILQIEYQNRMSGRMRKQNVRKYTPHILPEGCPKIGIVSKLPRWGSLEVYKQVSLLPCIFLTFLYSFLSIVLPASTLLNRTFVRTENSWLRMTRQRYIMDMQLCISTVSIGMQGHFSYVYIYINIYIVVMDVLVPWSDCAWPT